MSHFTELPETEEDSALAPCCHEGQGTEDAGWEAGTGASDNYETLQLADKGLSEVTCRSFNQMNSVTCWLFLPNLAPNVFNIYCTKVYIFKEFKLLLFGIIFTLNDFYLCFI